MGETLKVNWDWKKLLKEHEVSNRELDAQNDAWKAPFATDWRGSIESIREQVGNINNNMDRNEKTYTENYEEMINNNDLDKIQETYESFKNVENFKETETKILEYKAKKVQMALSIMKMRKILIEECDTRYSSLFESEFQSIPRQVQEYEDHIKLQEEKEKATRIKFRNKSTYVSKEATHGNSDSEDTLSEKSNGSEDETQGKQNRANKIYEKLIGKSKGGKKVNKEKIGNEALESDAEKTDINEGSYNVKEEINQLQGRKKRITSNEVLYNADFSVILDTLKKTQESKMKVKLEKMISKNIENEDNNSDVTDMNVQRRSKVSETLRLVFTECNSALPIPMAQDILPNLKVRFGRVDEDDKMWFKVQEVYFLEITQSTNKSSLIILGTQEQGDLLNSYYHTISNYTSKTFSTTSSPPEETKVDKDEDENIDRLQNNETNEEQETKVNEVKENNTKEGNDNRNKSLFHRRSRDTEKTEETDENSDIETQKSLETTKKNNSKAFTTAVSRRQTGLPRMNRKTNNVEDDDDEDDEDDDNDLQEENKKIGSTKRGKKAYLRRGTKMPTSSKK